MKKILLWVGAGILAMVIVFSSNVEATSISYVTGPNEPWNVPHNQQAMDTAFGTDWNQFTFSNAIESGILTNTGFIYIDGGGESTDGFTSFVNTNRTALEDWVTDGGSLFLNAARLYDFPDLDMGFGVTLHHKFDTTYSKAALAMDHTHTIFNGPNGNAGTSWTGNYFAHEYVTGTDLTYLISGYDVSNGNYVGSVMAEKDYGLGHLMVGGMTSSYWHNPDPYADNLRENILNYGADCAAAPIPEPATCFLFGTGLIGLSRIVGRKRKKKDC